jgi:hypothetical protein
VFSNYEASLQCDLELPADEGLVVSVREYVRRLYADTEVCLELTDELLQELTNPRYRIGDEDATRPSSADDPSSETQDVDDLGSDEDIAHRSAFGKSKEPRPRDPAPQSTRRSRRNREGPGERGPAKPRTPPLGEGGPEATLDRRWFKKMSYSDAQQRRTPNSNVKGIVTLGQARHPIDPTTYFRSDFFAALAWSTMQVPKGVKESADVIVEVVVAGVSYGNQLVSIDHQPSRISDQSNVPTWLHWEGFGSYLRTHNHVGDFVSLERFDDSSFRIVIDPKPSGPFVGAESTVTTTP